MFDYRRTTKGEWVSDTTVIQPSMAADPKVTELIAIAAAVGSNCEACFRSHHDRARSAGVSTEELAHAVSVAETVKATSARRVLELAARKLDLGVAEVAGAEVASRTELGDRAQDHEGCGCDSQTTHAESSIEADDSLCC